MFAFFKKNKSRIISTVCIDCFDVLRSAQTAYLYFRHLFTLSVTFDLQSVVKRTFAIRFRYLLMNAVALLILRSYIKILFMTLFRYVSDKSLSH